MKHSIRQAAAVLLMSFAAVTLVQAESAMSKYNVVWDSPSEDYNGTMPIGNGDLAANLWVEPTGDLIFYISKSDAWSGGWHIGSELLKLGRVRVKMNPPLCSETTEFKQVLDLEAGAIRIECKTGAMERRLNFWVDANRPVINLEIDSKYSINASVGLESWRAEEQYLRGGAQKDVILNSDGKTIRWYQRNVSSVYDKSFKVQKLEHLVGKFDDPLIDRTFGGLITGEGFEAKDKQTLVTGNDAKRVRLRIHALTEQTETAEQWLAQLESQQQVTDAVSNEEAWSAHVAWWKAFWDRSYIHLSGSQEAEAVAKAYHLQRWIQAGAGRGAYPIKFNGSLFTVDGLDARWAKPEGIYSGPDYRRWDGPYWFQNTRLIYWPMLYSGDYDMMRPLFNMYQEMLPLLRERTKTYYGHEGVFFSETTMIWGLARDDSFGENTPGFNVQCPFTRWYWQSGLELSAMLFDYYSHTQDERFVRETLLPIADEVVLFYDQHYSRSKWNREGTMVITPASSLETWHTAVDPLPDIVGLHVAVDSLLDLPEKFTSEKQRKRWADLKKQVPAIPKGEEGAKQFLKPARLFADKRNAENPELYAIFPYRTHILGKPELDLAIETYNRQLHKLTGGWRQTAIQAAMLGLTEEAKGMVIESATAKNWGGKADYPQCRFPAFWGPNFDWIPDQCHGSVLITALQRMLMLTDADTIHLMPAWPDDWKATFKLHAPYKTVVEGRVEGGKLLDLKVTPESRRKDVVMHGKSDKQKADK